MKRLLCLLALLTGWGSTYANDDKKEQDRFGFYLTQNRKVTRIPFQLHSNLIIVPVFINNSDTLHFILDTGVSATIITDPAAVRRMPMRYTRKVKLSGAGEGGQLQASVAIGNTLAMGAMRGAQQNIVVLEEDILKLSEYVGIPVHGIFGYELFNHFVVTIDFQRHELVLKQPGTYRYRRSHGIRYPIMIQDTKPYTDVLALVDNGRTMPLRVVIDTGAGHALLINRHGTTDDIRLPDKVIRAQLGRGLSGVINGNLGRIQKIRFGNYELENVVASFPDSVAFGMKIQAGTTGRNGNIGCELLRRFRVTLNYADKYVVLKPVRKMLRETFEHDMSGMELKARGNDLRTYYVERIIDDSPAARAGLQEGDELLFINNAPARQLNISEIYKIMQRGEGKAVGLMVRRSGQVFFTEVILKRMI